MKKVLPFAMNSENGSLHTADRFQIHRSCRKYQACERTLNVPYFHVEQGLHSGEWVNHVVWLALMCLWSFLAQEQT